MIFNPGLTKQVQEVKLSTKNKKLFHSTLLFNNIPLLIETTVRFKTLGLTLEIELKLVNKINKKKCNYESVAKVLTNSTNDICCVLTLYKTLEEIS